MPLANITVATQRRKLYRGERAAVATTSTVGEISDSSSCSYRGNWGQSVTSTVVVTYKLSLLQAGLVDKNSKIRKNFSESTCLGAGFQKAGFIFAILRVRTGSYVKIHGCCQGRLCRRRACGMDGAEDSGRTSAGLMKHNPSWGYAFVLNQQDFILLLYVATKYWVCWCRKNVSRCSPR